MRKRFSLFLGFEVFGVCSICLQERSLDLLTVIQVFCESMLQMIVD